MTLPAPALSEAITHALWSSNPNALASAIQTDRTRIERELKDLDRREAEIRQQRDALAYQARLLDELLASRPAAQGAVKDSAATNRRTRMAEKKPADTPTSAKKATGHVSPSGYLHPADRARRKQLVMAAAVRYAQANGPEFAARELVPFLKSEKIDLAVDDSRASTAVSNIIFHGGDARFSLVKQGLFHFEDTKKAGVVRKEGR